jgi:HSP20 family molecular chaperone IbpA
MKSNRMISDELLYSIDVLNTISGGMSEPIIELQQYENYREIKCAVPGVQEDALQVEVHNNFLSVYCRLKIETAGKQVQVPRVIYNKPIPYFIDATKISANKEGRYLYVTLPYNELANGYHKRISIND